MTTLSQCQKTLSRVRERIASVHDSARPYELAYMISGYDRLILRQACDELEAVALDLEKMETKPAWVPDEELRAYGRDKDAPPPISRIRKP